VEEQGIKFCRLADWCCAYGNTDKGLSTGHATYDWSNRFDHAVGRLTPFGAVGIGDTVMDSRLFQRPFTSFGNLAHFEGGADVDLSHSFTLTLSAYDIAPWGNQTIVSRFVGASRKCRNI